VQTLVISTIYMHRLYKTVVP